MCYLCRSSVFARDRAELGRARRERHFEGRAEFRAFHGLELDAHGLVELRALGLCFVERRHAVPAARCVCALGSVFYSEIFSVTPRPTSEVIPDTVQYEP